MNRERGNSQMQAYILNREIDNMRATLFRQTMFAEFEKSIHARRLKPNNPFCVATTVGSSAGDSPIAIAGQE